MGKGEDLHEEFFAVTEREIPNLAEALLVVLLGLRIKATRTASMFAAGVWTLVRRGPFLLQHKAISFRLLAKFVNCLFARSLTLYQSVHGNISEYLLHSLFRCKTIQLPPFDLQSNARCPPFYKLVCWLSVIVISDCL
jgi:hypothetical protein